MTKVNKGLGQFTLRYKETNGCPIFGPYLKNLRILTLNVLSNFYDDKMKNVSLDDVVKEIRYQKRRELLAICVKYRKKKSKKYRTRICMVALRYYDRFHNRNYPKQDNTDFPFL